MPLPRLIVGLGNPGNAYEDHRHNLGFQFIDRLARTQGITLSSQGKFFGMLGRGKEVWLLKPATYMNRSGQAVAALANFYKIAIDEILVVHDELDLPPGGIRVKQGGSHGGHNGIKDIQSCLGSADFWRLRLGIGHPGDRAAVTGYVLAAPREDERPLIERAFERCLLAWPRFATGDYEAAQRALHTKTDG